MSGFANSILGGIGTLIRDYIQSQNFVSGVAGWRISKNGDAELNDVLIRGTIELPLVTEPGEIGTVWFNDGRTQEHAQIFCQEIGLFISGGSDNATPSHDAFILLEPETLFDNGIVQLSTAGIPGIHINASALLVGNRAIESLVSRADNGSEIRFGLRADGLRFGQNQPGFYYARDATFTDVTVPVSTGYTPITSFNTRKETSDYGSPWSGGFFTAPVDAFYDTSLVLDSGSGPASTATVRIQHVSTGGSEINTAVSSAGSGRSTCSVSWTNIWMLEGEQLRFLLSQTGTGTQQISGRMSVGRRL